MIQPIEKKRNVTCDVDMEIDCLVSPVSIIYEDFNFLFSSSSCIKGQIKELNESHLSMHDCKVTTTTFQDKSKVKKSPDFVEQKSEVEKRKNDDLTIKDKCCKRLKLKSDINFSKPKKTQLKDESISNPWFNIADVSKILVTLSLSSLDMTIRNVDANFEHNFCSPDDKDAFRYKSFRSLFGMINII